MSKTVSIIKDFIIRGTPALPAFKDIAKKISTTKINSSIAPVEESASKAKLVAATVTTSRPRFNSQNGKRYRVGVKVTKRSPTTMIYVIQSEKKDWPGRVEELVGPTFLEHAAKNVNLCNTPLKFRHFPAPGDRKHLRDGVVKLYTSSLTSRDQSIDNRLTRGHQPQPTTRVR
ncbi:hypothetical protein GALMADRAFT_212700 [Galerina marginata CBS 339.88]|uniref:Uncharacterized protein n=1 Tax=Galerina marginata (strain CBS 339.88) TaxID=685588 RepID=A0A067SQS7_GALM3|nr:hypothetical protein GALMADRAFT_212700 [Galerina marginata CBS 339.88]